MCNVAFNAEIKLASGEEVVGNQVYEISLLTYVVVLCAASAASKGIDIEPTSRRYVRYAADGFVSYLQFKFVDRSDMGKYICEIQNITLGAADGETTKQEFHLKVICKCAQHVASFQRIGCFCSSVNSFHFSEQLN